MIRFKVGIINCRINVAQFTVFYLFLYTELPLSSYTVLLNLETLLMIHTSQGWFLMLPA